MARIEWLVATFSLALLTGAAAALPAQDPQLRHPLKVAEFDPATNRMKASLPFGEAFLLKVPVPEGVRSVELEYGRVIVESGLRAIASAGRDSMAVPSGHLTADAVSFTLPPLDPRNTYQFTITYHDSVAVPGTFATKRARKTVRGVTGEASASGVDHLVIDLGVLRTEGARYWGAVTTVHAYPEPINRRESLGWLGLSEFATLRRLSAFIGLNVAEFDSEADVERFFPAGSPVVGVGLRVHRVLRLSVGSIFFKQADPNPLVDTKHTKVDRFVALTLDVDYKTVLGPVGSLLGGG